MYWKGTRLLKASLLRLRRVQIDSYRNEHRDLRSPLWSIAGFFVEPAS